MVPGNLDPKGELLKRLERFKEHVKSTSYSDLLRDPPGGAIFPSGRLQTNTSLSSDILKAAGAMGCDVSRCNMKYWSDPEAKEIVGKMVMPGTPGSMVINVSSEGLATLHMQNVMDEEPGLRPARKHWVPVSVESYGSETYFIIHLSAAKIRGKRRPGKSGATPAATPGTTPAATPGTTPASEGEKKAASN